MHHYYCPKDSNKIDLAKMRDDAQARLDGKGPFRGAHEESIIHRHEAYIYYGTQPKQVKESVPCEGYEHLYYKEATDGTPSAPVV